MKIIYQGKPREIEENANGFVAAKALEPENKNKIIAYKVGEKTFDMRRVLLENEEIVFIHTSDKEAFEILNHSTSHLMAQAIKRLHPQAKFGYGPAIEEGFYYDVDFGDESLTENDFAAIEAEMARISKENFPLSEKMSMQKRLKKSL